MSFVYHVRMSLSTSQRYFFENLGNTAIQISHDAGYSSTSWTKDILNDCLLDKDPLFQTTCN